MKTKLLALSFAALSGCAFQGQEVVNMNNVHEVDIQSYTDERIDDTLYRFRQTYAPDEILFVFDVDNTLLTSPEGQFFGSDEWYDWQKHLADDDKAKVTCRLDIQGIAYNMAHLETTEDDALKLTQKLQQQEIDTLVLTARGTAYRYPTERELTAAGFDFKANQPEASREYNGISGNYQPEAGSFIAAPRDASYQNGIMMVSGQHKGAMLRDMLLKIDAVEQYKAIAFFDDKQKNITNMMDAFIGQPVDLVAFHYQGVDTHASHSEKQTAKALGQQLELFYQAFKRRPGCDI